jgi:hypothetical protein
MHVQCKMEKWTITSNTTGQVASTSGEANGNTANEVEDGINVVGKALDFDIVGLFGSTNGRSCCIHKICGKSMEAGDILCLVRTIVDINSRTESAIKLVKIIDGVDGCTVGLVPRVQSKLPKVVNCLDKFAVIRELYSSSINSYKREKSNKNHGVASATLLDYISRDE